MRQRQHTVPRTYLRGFADPKERLRAFDRMRQETLKVGVANATVVKGIYDVPINADGLDTDAIEKYIAERESAAAGSLREIRSG